MKRIPGVVDGTDFVSEQRNGVSDIVPTATSGRCSNSSVPESWVHEEG